MSANFNLGDVSKNVPGFSRVTINSTFDKENSSLPWFEIALDPFNVNFRFNGTQIENFSETKLYQKLIVKKILDSVEPNSSEKTFQAFVGRWEDLRILLFIYPRSALTIPKWAV